MKLYGHPMSTCTRKVLTVLAEKQYKAEFVLVDLSKGEQKQPAHLARQPFESRAMCRYLDETLPGAKLTPSTAKDRALMEQWISVEQSYFTPPAMKIVYQTFFGPMRGQPTDEALLKEAREATTKIVTIL